MWARPVFVAVILVLTACSSPAPLAADASPVADDGPGGVVAAANYCEQISDFFCDFYLRCGRTAAQSKAECLQTFEESCNSNFEGAYQELEALGLLALSADGIASCRTHLEGVVCEQQLNELSGPCAGMWIGSQDSGAACGLDTEFFVCKPDNDCVLDLSFCGTCRPRVALGNSCTPIEESCGQEGFCQDGTCVARKLPGESCLDLDRCTVGSRCEQGICQPPTFVALGDACDTRLRCPYQSACIDGLCQSSARLGESCSASLPCAAGYCGDQGLCQEPLAEGASCQGSAWCRSGLCVDQQCQARPSACLR